MQKKKKSFYLYVWYHELYPLWRKKYKQFKEISEFKGGFEIINSMQ